MRTTTMAAAVAATMMMTMTVTLFAAEQPASATAGRSEPIYGYRMMNGEERNEYREKMRNARSADERQAVRDEHHKLMEARAKERGVTLPEPRGPGAGGPGKGMGPGAGMGPGGGMGPGPRAEGKGQGYGPGAGKGPGGQGERGGGQGAGKGQGPRADCPGAADCPGPGAGKGQGPRPN